MNSEKLHGVQVEYCQRVILLAGNEREPIRLVQRNAVRILNAWQLVSANNLHRSRIDWNQIIHTINRYEHAA